MLPAANMLAFLKPVLASNRAPLLVFGNPDLGDPRLDLSFAEGEARYLAGAVPGSRMLLRKDASENNFRKVARAFSRIHFATHGKFNSD
ncbi:MAG: CHAT domain-containing protein [Candidatus Protistobacter heckmanni]|nr:CHAT domain-containing protein [Candidatus Protistobacter heckmanni]